MSTARQSTNAPVEFRDVSLSFGSRSVLRGLCCDFPRGKISVILGGSGVGKTTILRLVGGLIRPTEGHVIVAGKDISKLSDRKLYETRRQLGMLFQGGALLDSLTVHENIAFPLREHTKMGEDEIAAEVRTQLEAVGLDKDVEPLLPGQLSGGMVKRAALARAMIRRPAILLCDEPFSGLDPISVGRIEALLVRICREHDITMLVSSHHIPSTLRMADQIVLLFEDRTLIGSPKELVEHEDDRVREFLHIGPQPFAARAQADERARAGGVH